ncbi:MAG: protein-glutamate O-methyltransferase CheR [Fibrobacteria bacterium]|nr:protein-glutamate O-methyltransferase CheR [Fibrobacteria bacterium]
MKINRQEFINLRNYIYDSCGIMLGDEKDYLIESRLKNLAAETECRTFGELYFKIKFSKQTGLRDKVIDAMCTKETLWFRDQYPFDCLEQKILTQYKDLEDGKKVRLWSMACATGQEPYSIAMVIHNFCKLNGLDIDRFEVLASDISPSALFLAMNGNYDTVSINRGLPTRLRDKYFTKTGALYCLKDEIKKMVTFKKLNLQHSFGNMGALDVIFFRNVAIYFGEAFKKQLYSKIARALNPGGYLIIGGSESFNHEDHGFEMFKFQANGRYYRLKEKI